MLAFTPTATSLPKETREMKKEKQEKQNYFISARKSTFKRKDRLMLSGVQARWN